MEDWRAFIEEDQTLHPDTKRQLLNLLDLIQREFEKVFDNPSKTLDEIEIFVRGAIAVVQYLPNSRPSVKIWTESFQKAVRAWRAYYSTLRLGQARNRPFEEAKAEARRAMLEAQIRTTTEEDEEEEAQAQEELGKPELSFGAAVTRLQDTERRAREEEAQRQAQELIRKPVPRNPGWFENPEDAEALAPEEEEAEAEQPQPKAKRLRSPQFFARLEEAQREVEEAKAKANKWAGKMAYTSEDKVEKFVALDTLSSKLHRLLELEERLLRRAKGEDEYRLPETVVPPITDEWVSKLDSADRLAFQSQREINAYQERLQQVQAELAARGVLNPEEEGTPDSLQGGGKIGQWLKKLFTKKVPPKQPVLTSLDRQAHQFVEEMRQREKMLEQISQGKVSGGGFFNKDWYKRYQNARTGLNDHRTVTQVIPPNVVVKPSVIPTLEELKQQATKVEPPKEKQPQPLVKPAKLSGAYVNTGVVDAKKRIDELLKKVQKPTEN